MGKYKTTSNWDCELEGLARGFQLLHTEVNNKVALLSFSAGMATANSTKGVEKVNSDEKNANGETSNVMEPLTAKRMLRSLEQKPLLRMPRSFSRKETMISHACLYFLTLCIQVDELGRPCHGSSAWSTTSGSFHNRSDIEWVVKLDAVTSDSIVCECPYNRENGRQLLYLHSQIISQQVWLSLGGNWSQRDRCKTRWNNCFHHAACSTSTSQSDQNE